MKRILKIVYVTFIYWKKYYDLLHAIPIFKMLKHFLFSISENVDEVTKPKGRAAGSSNTQTVC